MAHGDRLLLTAAAYKGIMMGKVKVPLKALALSSAVSFQIHLVSKSILLDSLIYQRHGFIVSSTAIINGVYTDFSVFAHEMSLVPTLLICVSGGL